MNINELAKLNKLNGGHFFNSQTMAHFGDTLKSFSIKTDKKAGVVTITRKSNGRKWAFDMKTGRVLHSVQFDLTGEVPFPSATA